MLTAENYYEDTSYLSASRVKSYMDCEAKQQAIDNGLWAEEEDNKNFLIGNFIHSFFESQEAFNKFMDDNQDKLIAKSGKNKGGLLADYQVAEKVCQAIQQDEEFQRRYNSGTVKELIVTGELYGLPFKGKLDSVNLEKGYFIDLKTLGSIHAKKYLSEFKQEVPQVIYNIFTYGYDMQFYIYRELLMSQEEDFFDGYIMAVSKEDTPQKLLLEMDEFVYESGKKRLEKYIGRLNKVLSGKLPANRCEKCEYCRSSQQNVFPVKLTNFLNNYTN